MTCCHAAKPEPAACCTTADLGTSWWRIGLSAVLAGQTMMFGLGYNQALRAAEAPAFGSDMYWLLHGFLALGAIGPMLLLGGPLLGKLFAAVARARITIEGLFVLTALGALAGSIVGSLTGQADVYYEVVAIVLVIYAVGSSLGERSRARVQAAVRQLRGDLDFARLPARGGARPRVHLRDLPLGTLVEVLPGEAIPVDGEVAEGRAYVEQAALTGEPAPVPRQAGDQVRAGSHSVDGRLLIRSTAPYGERMLDCILHTLETARAQPSDLQRRADALVRLFLPMVVAISLGTFLGWYFLAEAAWWRALFNAMAVLLVACPCALGLATPVAVWGGLLRLSALGIVARSGQFLDALARVTHVVFDKTGTLSGERLALAEVRIAPAFESERERLLAAVAAVEQGQAHPCADALANLAPGRPRPNVEQLRLWPAAGIEAVVEGRQLRVGRPNWAAPGEPLESAGRQVIAIGVDGLFAGAFEFEEELRPGTRRTLESLPALGLTATVLTGDANPRWQTLHGVEVLGGLSPADKHAHVEALALNGEELLFVGDGINDTPAMCASGCSLAMGGGAALARASADAVLMGDTLAPIPEAVSLARRVRASVLSNFRFALAYNILGISLAAAGILHPVVAALLMLGSSALVSARALRAVGEPMAPAQAVALSSPQPATQEA